ncbi:MAG: hypothetical protein K6E73_04985 [Bacteroidales bacterium]|nr:hypothetical protein [Bacteroidales bacterium]
MKSLFITLILATCSISTFAQLLDGYNCIYLNSNTNNQWGLDDIITKSCKEKGFKIVTSPNDIPKPQAERLATLELTYDFEIRYGGSPFHIYLKNMFGEEVFSVEAVANRFMSAKSDAVHGCRRALGKIEEMPYRFDPTKTPHLSAPTSAKSNWSERQIREYLSSSDIHEVEGIYKNIGGSFFQLAIIRENDKYYAFVMNTDHPNWYTGNVKAVLEKLRDSYFSTCYYEDNYSKKETISELEENGVLKIENHSYMKIFPIKGE